MNDPGELERTAEETAPATGAPTLAPGATVGRFVVLGVLGAGGMGVVLSAYDPELDRKVAVKLLHGDAGRGSESEGRARLAREAQAMARLSHPNVVAVYEVGTVGDRLFIVMEQVDGQTLKQWLKAEERGWREVVAMFLAAGRGLEAAHRAGLVHRDFKPSNVLVGRDGRVRISDFGLVSVSASTGELGALDATLTAGLVGTPAYMSPEHLRNQELDGRADQFSYCVALYQALYDARPFASDSVIALREAVLTGRPRPPSARDVPAWLGPIVLRGLARDPAERWPSMTALLDALARDPAAARRRLAGRAALVGLGLAAVLGGLQLRLSRRNQCDAGARLGGVWDATVRDRLRRAFSDTKASYSEETFTKVATRLDDYARAWRSMSEEACRATRVEGRQSDTLLDLRMACLDRRRSLLGALTEQWGSGMSPRALEQSLAAASRLPAIDECADAQALTERAPLPRDPQLVARIAAVRAQLDHAYALLEAREWKRALAEGEAAHKDATATGWPQVQAEAAMIVANTLWRGEDARAVTWAEEAARFAGAARDDRLAARGLILAVRSLADPGGEAANALALAAATDTIVARAGNPPDLRGRLLLVRGAALRAAARYPEAERALLEALALLEPLHQDSEVIDELAMAATSQEHFDDARKWGELVLAKEIAESGPDHPSVAAGLNNLGILFATSGDLQKSLEYFQRADRIEEKALGPDTLRGAVNLSNMCGVGVMMGRLAVSRAWCVHALAIREKTLGPDHPLLSSTLNNLSSIDRRLGKLDDALTEIRRALAIREKAAGPQHPEVAESLQELGLVLGARGDLDGATGAFTRAYEINKKVQGATHSTTLGNQVSLADVLARRGRCREAKKTYDEALPVLEKQLGREHPNVGETLSSLARCELSSGDGHAAAEHFARALAIAEKKQMGAGAIGALRAGLARALSSTGQRDEARAAATQAERELAASEEAESRAELGRLRAERR
jgi:serine/threonine-protein kinase